MPRRRGPKVRPVDRKQKKSASNKRWNNREDIPLDEVDEFHEQRDKILLEGEAPIYDSDEEEEEVFALEGLDDSFDEAESEGEVDAAGLEDEAAAPERKKSNRERKKELKSKKKKKAESSDEDGEEESGEEEESWGKKKSAYYSSNAAQLDSEDEEAHDMEEQEALRIQAKLREPMREEDFGFIDAQQLSVQDRAEEEDIWNPTVKPSPALEGTDRLSILRHMEKTCPETLGLAQDWEDVVQSILKTDKKLAEMEKLGGSETSLGLTHVYQQTQMVYATLVAFYLHLRTSEPYASRPELLQQHPIVKRLLVLKQSMIRFEDLGLFDEEKEEEEEEEEDSANDDTELWLAARKMGLEIGELEDLLRDAVAKKASERSETKSGQNKHTPKVAEPPKKKRKVEKEKAVPEVIFDVEEPTLPKKKGKTNTVTFAQNTASDAFGEATGLDAVDVEDKVGRRHALRFHTSKIESANARRQNARNAMGGDEDIPYRERRKQAESKKKLANLGAGGDDLDDVDPEPQQREKRAREDVFDGLDDDVEDGEDGYYSLVKKQKRDKKAMKKAEYEAQKEELRNTSFDDDDSVDGQRGITRAILKNKGLTPRRSKSVRNPRVKKRQKFEKAQKKLSSQKAVYKGGLNATGGYYGGEKSGISLTVKGIKYN